MGDALGDLVQLVAVSALWRLVSEWVRDQPPAVQLLAGVAAAGLFVLVRWRRSRRRSRPRPGGGG